MQYPNQLEIYFWKPYDGGHGNWYNSVTSNNFDRANDSWKGKWVQFNSQHSSVLDRQFAEAFATGFVGAISLIAGGMAASGALTAMGKALSGPLMEMSSNLAYRLLPYYYPTIAAGKLGLEFLDETGSVGLAHSGRAIFNKDKLLNEFKGHMFSSKHIRDGIESLGSTQDEILESVGNTIEMNLGNLREGYNTIKVNMNNQIALIKAYVKDGEELSVNLFKGNSERSTDHLIDLTEEIGLPHE